MQTATPEPAKIIVASDAKTVSCINHAGDLRWTAGAPSLEVWTKLSPKLANYSAQQLQNGSFLYANGRQDGCLAVVFCPHGGLDWNLTYDTLTGELKHIVQAR